MLHKVSYLLLILHAILGMPAVSTGVIYTSSSTATFQWMPPEGPPPAHYRIYSSNNAVNYNVLAETTAASYTFNVTPGSTNYIAVQGVNSSGNAGPMSDTSDALVVVSAKNTLHSPWWSTQSGTICWALVKNTSDTPLQASVNVIGLNGASYIDPAEITIPAHNSRYLSINDYALKLAGQESGALEITHSGKPGDMMADVIGYRSDGSSYMVALRAASGTSTTLHTPWWVAFPGWTSSAMIKNTSDKAIQVTASVIGYNGAVYIDPAPLVIPPHNTKYLKINDYTAKLGGQLYGALEIAHTGNPGDAVAELMVAGPLGQSFSAAMKDSTASSNTLHSPWWVNFPGWASHALVKNTSNNTVRIVASAKNLNGGSYTDPAATLLLPHNTTYIPLSTYGDRLNTGNGSLEIVHDGNPGDIIADLIVFRTDGPSYTISMQDSSNLSTDLHTTWWNAQAGYSSWALLKNTSDRTIDATLTVVGLDGSLYTDPQPVPVAPHYARYVLINNYVDKLNGQRNGALEITHTGKPGDMIADMIVIGPGGQSFATHMR